MTRQHTGGPPHARWSVREALPAHLSRYSSATSLFSQQRCNLGLSSGLVFSHASSSDIEQSSGIRCTLQFAATSVAHADTLTHRHTGEECVPPLFHNVGEVATILPERAA